MKEHIFCAVLLLFGIGLVISQLQQRETTFELRYPSILVEGSHTLYIMTSSDLSECTAFCNLLDKCHALILMPHINSCYMLTFDYIKWESKKPPDCHPYLMYVDKKALEVKFPVYEGNCTDYTCGVRRKCKNLCGTHHACFCTNCYSGKSCGTKDADFAGEYGYKIEDPNAIKLNETLDLQGCARKCLDATEFECLSFNHRANDTCQLTHFNRWTAPPGALHGENSFAYLEKCFD